MFFYNPGMPSEPNYLAGVLERAVAEATDRTAALQRIARLIQDSGGYRWVGIYDVDRASGTVRNIVWSGPAAPEYPTFSIHQGLTASAVATRKTVNVGDVAADARYLTAFGTTKSEIIVPVLDGTREHVVGTIDVESEAPSAFGRDVQTLLEECSRIIEPLWAR